MAAQCFFWSAFLFISISLPFADTVIFLTSLSGSRKKKYALFLVTHLLWFPPPWVGHIAITHRGSTLLGTTGLNTSVPSPSHSNLSSQGVKLSLQHPWNALENAGMPQLLLLLPQKSISAWLHFRLSSQKTKSCEYSSHLVWLPLPSQTESFNMLAERTLYQPGLCVPTWCPAAKDGNVWKRHLWVLTQHRFSQDTV